MVCSHSSFMHCQRPACYFSLVFLLLLSTSTQLMTYIAEGSRPHPTSHTFSQVQKVKEEEEAILRGQIGSRPPRCERRCSSCGHCEAIQVPTNPQNRNHNNNNNNNNNNNSTLLSHVAYASRGDYSSNYKPMSWKCKCGNFIFNP